MLMKCHCVEICSDIVIQNVCVIHSRSSFLRTRPNPLNYRTTAKQQAQESPLGTRGKLASAHTQRESSAQSTQHSCFGYPICALTANHSMTARDEHHVDGVLFEAHSAVLCRFASGAKGGNLLIKHWMVYLTVRSTIKLPVS